MKLTDRDLRLIRDVCLSHVLSRDQILALGYFTSVSRANRRLSALVSAHYLKVLQLPFKLQRLFVAGTKSSKVVGPRIASVIRGRAGTPRFLQHSLAVTEIRIATAVIDAEWRFEPQVRDQFRFGPRLVEVRPDGAVLSDSTVEFIEADLGNVSAAKYAAKISGYARYMESDRYWSSYGDRASSVLTVTTGSRRMSHLQSLLAGQNPQFRFTTFDQIGAASVEGWS